MLPDTLTLLDGTEVVTLQAGARLLDVQVYDLLSAHHDGSYKLIKATTLDGVAYYSRAQFDPRLWGDRGA